MPPSAATPLLYWSGETADASYQTGVQRVVRGLAGGLLGQGCPILPVAWDHSRRVMKAWHIRDEPVLAHLLAHPPNAQPWLLLPELAQAAYLNGADPVQLAHAYGLRTAAILHDLIPVKLGRLYQPAVRQGFVRYYRSLAVAALVFATTELVAADFRRFLAERGLPEPPIVVEHLPAQFGARPRVPDRPMPPLDGGLRLLAVATWERRKNLHGLLRALRATRIRPAVTLVGLRGVDPAYDAEIAALLDDMPEVTVAGHTSDDILAGQFAQHHASIYPSTEEGFGLPVVESLWLGAPCICHAGSAMAEVAPGGGTIAVDMADEAAVTALIDRLAADPALLARSAAEIPGRPLRSWRDYAGSILAGLNRPVPS